MFLFPILSYFTYLFIYLFTLLNNKKMRNKEKIEKKTGAKIKN